MGAEPSPKQLYSRGYLIIGILLAVELLFGAVIPAFANTSVPNFKLNRSEIGWMMNTIDYQSQAVEMAKTCQQKAIHSELQNLCAKMVIEGSDEMLLLQTRLEDWYIVSAIPETDQSNQPDIDKLSTLSGQNFEIEFLNLMILYNNNPSNKVEVCSSLARHPESFVNCQATACTQEVEVQQMQSWLCAWYGVCGTQPLIDGE